MSTSWQFRRSGYCVEGAGDMESLYKTPGGACMMLFLDYVVGPSNWMGLPSTSERLQKVSVHHATRTALGLIQCSITSCRGLALKPSFLYKHSFARLSLILDYRQCSP